MEWEPFDVGSGLPDDMDECRRDEDASPYEGTIVFDDKERARRESITGDEVDKANVRLDEAAIEWQKELRHREPVDPEWGPNMAKILRTVLDGLIIVRNNMIREAALEIEEAQDDTDGGSADDEGRQ